ncbi:hypothetical protein ACR79S_09410 [Sphingobacterium spiritivorum]|uniref:hypothetical protein n=1 Tax=Sphingobacterium spiritivorum TaxID=258 RepID=UPI003DA5DC95
MMTDAIKIPGLIQNEWREYVYILIQNGEELFSGRSKNKTGVIDNIINTVQPLIPKSGRIIDENFIIVTPDNRNFYCTSYSKDIDGWRKQIKLGSEQLNIITAVVTPDKMLSTSDDRIYKLEDCEFEYYNFYESNEVVTTRRRIDKIKLRF